MPGSEDKRTKMSPEEMAKKKAREGKKKQQKLEEKKMALNIMRHIVGQPKR